MRVLVIERHKLLARALERGLAEEGWTVHVISDGEANNLEALAADCDAIIFDPLLQERDRSLPRRWRLRGIDAPILVLTTPGDTNKPEGWELAADASLSKPFDLEELFCRLRALTQRTVAGFSEDPR